MTLKKRNTLLRRFSRILFWPFRLKNSRLVFDELAFQWFRLNYDKAQATRELSVVVLTCDPNPLFDACMASVTAQRLPATEVFVVRNQMPASKASQLGLERVKTPCYVSVDADMVLKPSCFERLYFTLRRTRNCAEARANLFDPILGVIECVRVYRTEPVRQIRFYPFEGEIGHDRYMSFALEKAGMRVIRCNRVEGAHHPSYEPHEAFWKFRMSGQKAFHYNTKGAYTPFRKILGQLVDYWERSGDDTAIYAIAGLFEGLNVDDPVQELTYEGRQDDPRCARLHEFLNGQASRHGGPD